MIIHNSLSFAHPLVQEWFSTRIGSPTEPQILGWPKILSGKTTLISAPTGSGKTLSAFMVCVNALVEKAVAGKLENKTEVIYVSPLKALSNDIQKNLTEPLLQIEELAKEKGSELQKIGVMVRTGDTPNRERQLMLRERPHILVTTPESLYILLTAEKSREMLKDVKTVIVDEIHAMVNSKRGAHLALSLERLEALTTTKPVRIGLSATQKPLELVAKFLCGDYNHLPQIVNVGHKRPLELSIEIPGQELGPVASNEMWDEIYDKIAELTKHNRSTLIFVNTRRLAERVAHHLSERLGEDKVAAHHGSLSRKLRLAAEHKLKTGELSALVATASLELGIDIGMIDLVCQIGTPRSINVALQRVGRAGHWHGAISKGIFFATTRDELFECAALIYAIKQGELDELYFPEEPLDILAQQIIATCATGDWQEAELFKMIKRAYPYHNLSEERFDAILELLSEGIAASRGRFGSYLFRDKVNSIVKARRGSRLIAITSGGAIPDNGLFTVLAEPDGVMVGTLDEDFAVESNRGDIILLGTTSWQVKRIEAAVGRVLVENAHGAPPSVPFWRGEAPGRTKELSYFVSLLRQKLDKLMPPQKPANIELTKQANLGETLAWLKQNCELEGGIAEQLLEYLLQGRAVLGQVPTQDTLIAERFFDETGGMQLVIHAPFGMRINKAWGLALRKKFCRSFNFELQAAATDNGLNISLAEQHSFPLIDVFQFLSPNNLKNVLEQAILQSPLFNTRWRWAATRALALVRFQKGRKVPPNIQRVLSDDLLAAVFPDAAACQDNLGGREIELPDHPLTTEAMKDCLHEAMDLEGFTQLISDIKAGKINCVAIDTPIPSVFSSEIINANPYAFLDDAPLEERRARAVEMRRVLPESVLQEVGGLDSEAIVEVQTQTWPDLRSPDELQDFLQTLIAFPENAGLSPHQRQKPEWLDFFSELINTGRAARAEYNHNIFWVVAEKKTLFQAIYPAATLLNPLKDIQSKFSKDAKIASEDAIFQAIRGWLSYSGPITNQELCDLLALSNSEVEQALLKLENSGFILRGKFRSLASITSKVPNDSNTDNTIDTIEWCERRLLARIHRMTIGRLRREIEPVSSLLFVKWLLKWQHLAPGTELRGEHGLLEVIRQLQGFEIPANAWEREIFAKRVKDYSRDLLDKLCLMGVVGWGRLSFHKALDEESSINPTSIVPITFFLHSETKCLPEHNATLSEENIARLSSVARNVYTHLKEKGASFLNQISRSVRNLESEIERGLWELVALGLITADSFDNLRSLIDPKRRLNRDRRRSLMQMSAGRWSLLEIDSSLETIPDSDLKEIEELKFARSKAEAICWMLLNRYGVVFRDLLAREKNILPWRDLLLAFRRLENRGEIRGGRFVDGFLGEQFALPVAVDSLRALRNQEKQPSNDSTTPPPNCYEIAAVDPLNLVGIILPGPRVSALSKNKVQLPICKEVIT